MENISNKLGEIKKMNIGTGEAELGVVVVAFSFFLLIYCIITLVPKAPLAQSDRAQVS